ncbi:type VI secretion system baseplate subunit TssG [Tatumella ptyseos]|uniref:type VI secretion system baseplate subunit TssG n=1 Tax=Tatumella ptyseos TaxID=82987 RepID=UPI0026ECCD76|nr:type VI secretion system baseplate subunit TssG [Tatumella ptyseos]WKX27304.1 type VI secretion system baseplate subunit TssG [Tatumella ptyseos]
MSSSQSSALLPKALKYLPLDTPWATNFLATLRQLSALAQDNPIPGNALSCKEENFRLSQAVSLAFPASEVASMCWQRNQLAIKLFSLGVWGPQGPLPLHFSELALTRFQQQDSALIDFIDLFHHRSMAIFFRAWHAAQDTASLDRPTQDRFSFYLRCLTGLSLSDTLSPVREQHQLLSTAFHLARKNCAPQDLVSTLKALFHLPFEIEEFQAGWIDLNGKEQSQLTHQAQLGINAVLGEASYQSGHRFKVWCGPLSYEQYCSLHPDKPKLASISNTIQRLTGGNYHYDIHLVLAVPHTLSTTLSGNRQLGFDAWLMHEATDIPQLGMIYTSRLSAD